MVGLAILPTPATSSTVLALSVDDLLDRSERVAHARVLSVEPRRQGAIVRSRIDLEILEDWRGVGEAHVVLDQPGGVVPGLGTHVFGMPRFVEGAEVVVFLSDDAPIGTRVVGLDQGKFDVRPDGTLVRDQSGLMLARVGDGPPVPLLAPDTLSELRAASLKADPR